MTDAYLRVRIRAAGSEALEIALAEAWEAGAEGVEEGADGLTATAYVPEAAARRVAAAVNLVTGAEAETPEAFPDVVWSDAWKEGLDAVVISPRLCVRPPFAEPPEGFVGSEIVIEPGQAFGTGHHASTRLALESLDATRARLAGARVLDVGCGSGVLALAAAMLGAGSVVAHDLDPLAGTASGEAALFHDAWSRVQVFTGTTDALAQPVGGSFDGIVANMIRSELEPLLGDFARLTRPGGWFVASGLLTRERERFGVSCRRVGFEITSERQASDGDDEWLSIVATRRAR